MARQVEISALTEQYSDSLNLFFQGKYSPSKNLLLAHYTSIDVVEKIVLGNEIWMSNPLFMNDIQELNHSMEVGAEIFREICDDINLPLENVVLIKNFFQHLINSLDRILSLDTYILCLMEHDRNNFDGALPMWRSYGDAGHGAAIIFDSAKLKYEPHFPFRLIQVTYYSDDEKRQQLKSLLNLWKGVTISQNKIFGSDSETLKAQAYSAYVSIRAFAIATKHKGFEYEKEWRFVYTRENDRPGFCDDFLSYNIGARGIEPKLKINVEKYNEKIRTENTGCSEIKLDIDHILLGPSTRYVSNLAHDAFRRALKGTQFQHLQNKVYASTIPLRPSK